MFRIDRSQVSYVHTGDVYTNVDTDRKTAETKKVEQASAELKRIEEEMERVVENARAQAEQMRACASAQARLCIRDAQAQAEALRKSALQDGYREGTEKAREEQSALRQAQEKQMEDMIFEIARARAAAVEELDEEIIVLIKEILQKVINVKLEKDDDIFIGLVQNALAKMKREGKVTIRVGSEEFGRLFPSGTAQFVVGNESVTVTVREEPSFNRGDCVLETDGEMVNAGIVYQLKRLELDFRTGRSVPS